ncbi:MAG: polyamine aminopropyltransferase [Candidatus Micrarchaeia archaeon]
MRETTGKWLVETSPIGRHLFKIKKSVANARSKYQEISIYELPLLGKTLVIDGDIQSSEFDERIYHESLVHPTLIANGNPEKVLIIGGGEGATLREVLKYKSVKEAVMVDLDDKVIALSKKYLPNMSDGAFEDPRAKVVIDDGKKFISRTNEKFDAIILDLTDLAEGNKSYALYSKEFYAKLKGILNEGGSIVTQSSSVLYGVEERLLAIRSNISHVFKNSATYVMPFIVSFDEPWSATYGSDYIKPEDMSAEEVDNRLRKLLKRKTYFYDGIMHEAMFDLGRKMRGKNPTKYFQA